MQVVINVEDSQLQEVMDKQLKALDSEYLGEVVAKAIEEYFRMDDYKNVEKLIFKETKYYGSERELTPVMQKAVANADYSGLQSVVDVCIEQLKTNYPQILVGAVSSLLANSFIHSGALEDQVRMIAASAAGDILNNIRQG